MASIRPLLFRFSSPAGNGFRPTRIALAAAALALPLLTGCKSKSAQEGGFQPPPPEVTIVAVAPRTVELPLEAPGRLEGSREVEVRPRVSGILNRRLFEEGNVVRKGQALFEIDPLPYRAEVQSAEATLAEEKARLSKAEREIARLEPLLSERAVSRKDYDAAVAEVEQARATVQSAQAELDKAKLDLGWTSVPAPISGVSSRAPLSEGSLVGPESLLTRIAQISPIWVRFSVPDERLLALDQAIASGKLKAPPADQREVELILADGSVHPVRGRVNFSDSRIDPATGAIDLRAEFANEDRRLVPGQFVRIRLVGVERPNAILVPQRAVLQGQQGKYVMVAAAGDVAEIKAVEVGSFVGDDWLIESGLQTGDRVIVDGVVKVQPGAAVRIAGEPAAEGAATPAPQVSGAEGGAPPTGGNE